MAQLKQRIAMTSYLNPLAADEVARYVDHRLRVAGLTDSNNPKPAIRKAVDQKTSVVPTHDASLGQVVVKLRLSFPETRRVVLQWMSWLNDRLSGAGRALYRSFPRATDTLGWSFRFAGGQGEAQSKAEEEAQV
jgi:hypothetical protein